MRWSAPANNGSAITSYFVTRFINGVPQPPSTVFKATTLSGNVVGLTYGKTYTFRVSARNANGVSPPSGPTPAMKLNCVGKAMVNGQSDIDVAPCRDDVLPLAERTTGP